MALVSLHVQEGLPPPSSQPSLFFAFLTRLAFLAPHCPHHRRSLSPLASRHRMSLAARPGSILGANRSRGPVVEERRSSPQMFHQPALQLSELEQKRPLFQYLGLRVFACQVLRAELIRVLSSSLVSRQTGGSGVLLEMRELSRKQTHPQHKG